MAQVYYPKKTPTKMMEGAVAGLFGAVAYSLVLLIADLLIADRSWWTSPSVIGGIITGNDNFNTAAPDVGSLLLGLLLTFAAFTLIGVGLINYMLLFRRFKVHPVLGGALYGLFIWVAVHLLFLNALTGGKLNLIALLVADVLAGAVMGWWLYRAGQNVQRGPLS
jgi:hypothetical protein